MKLLDVLWAILRGLFWGIVDDSPFGASAGPSTNSKESPWWEDQASGPPKERAASPAPEKPSTSKATTPGWWAAPAPPTTPPTIKVETDAGTFIATTTFSGPNLMGIRRVERPRQEGESRRRRRSATPAAPASPVTRTNVELRPREPAVPAVNEAGADAHEPVGLRPGEPAAPHSPAIAAEGARVGITADRGRASGATRSGVDAAVPIEPAEAPRVARARRVRGRLGETDRGAPRLATTLATRLALVASTLSSPAPAAVREGA
ncbi:hypothetical protein OV203_47140 [Nannocystis sp. ILAH1]|uniref:hypothetical protein n=1 Tax=Nannocystis sp. ILAH1 TaxID=2996789 RepID=UPI00226E4335|nr:hypothetical protein [Nannocystis sp. ILAH1]MCY0994793.1 hypothetical protein [Nannocystis sp. ILAH1]